MTASSSSEAQDLLKVIIRSDRTTLVTVGNKPEKRIGVLDSISFLKAVLPDVRDAMGVENEDIGSSMKFGKYLVSLSSVRDNGTLRALLYRPESRGSFSLEMRSSGGSVLPIYTSFFGKIVEHFGLDQLNAILSKWGGHFDKSKCVLRFDSLLYPNLLCEYKVNRLAEPDKQGNKLFGFPGSAVFKATSSPLSTIWATGDSLSAIPGKFYVPFSNFFHEGTMCFGTIARVENFLDNGNLRQFDYFLDVVLSSNFNFDLCHVGQTESLTNHLSVVKNTPMAKLLTSVDKNFVIPEATLREIGGNSYTYLMFVFMLADPELKTFPYNLFGV